MKSFDTFYYLKDRKWDYLEKVQEEYEKNNGNISKYKGHMMCPECRKAELSFTRKTSKKEHFYLRNQHLNMRIIVRIFW